MVCRQLGYPDALFAIRSAKYGQGTGPLWLNGVQCNGIEADLLACRHNGYYSSCYTGVAAVKCLGMYIMEQQYTFTDSHTMQNIKITI